MTNLVSRNETVEVEKKFNLSLETVRQIVKEHSKGMRCKISADLNTIITDSPTHWEKLFIEQGDKKESENLLQAVMHKFSGLVIKEVISTTTQEVLVSFEDKYYFSLYTVLGYIESRQPLLKEAWLKVKDNKELLKARVACYEFIINQPDELENMIKSRSLNKTNLKLKNN